MRHVILEAPRGTPLSVFDDLLKSSKKLILCPHGGGKACRKKGGDGAKWHYTGYQHPKDKAPPPGPEQMSLPGMEPSTPEWAQKKPIAVEAHEAGIQVESYVQKHPEEDEDEYEYWERGGETVKDEEVGSAIDEHVWDLLGSASLDDILDMFQIHVAGYSTKIESLKSTFYDEENDRQTPALAVSGIFIDDTGEKVGTFDRRFQIDPMDDVPSVYHQYFVLDAAHQGKNIGKEFLRSSISKYKDLGVSKVTVSPAWVGRYTWAKMGFDYGETGAYHIERELPDFLVDEYNMDHEDAIEIAHTHAGVPWELASLEIEGEKAGKEFLLSGHGDDVWEEGGTLHLFDGDPGYEHMKSYLGLGEAQKPEPAPPREPQMEQPRPRPLPPGRVSDEPQEPRPTRQDITPPGGWGHFTF